MKPIKQNKKGFTLVELLLYVGLSAILLLVISLFLTTMLAARAKQQTITEVEAQAMQMMQIITQSIRNAEGINSPLAGESASTLSLSMSDAQNNPTDFNMNQNTLQITEGSQSSINLSNTGIHITNFTVQNLSRNDTSGLVRISFDVNYNNESGRSEYNYNKSFNTSVSLR